MPLPPWSTFHEEASTQSEVEESDHPKAMAENDLEGWDRIVEDLDDEEGFMDYDGEDMFVKEVV